MQFLRIANDWPSVASYLSDGKRVEPAQILNVIRPECAANCHCSGTPFLNRRIVEERVNVRVHKLMAKWGWLTGFTGDQFYLASFYIAQDFHPTRVIHHFLQTI